MGRNTRPVPDDFQDFALRNTRDAARAHYRASSNTFARWAEETGITALLSARNPNRSQRTLPPDFKLFAICETNDDLAVRYNASRTTISKWRRETGTVRPRIVAPRIEMPSNFPILAPTMTRAEAIKRFKVSDNTLSRWLRETGTAFKPWLRFTSSLPLVKVPSGDVSLAGQAAHFLRRYYPNVYKAEILSDAIRKQLPQRGSGMFVVGNKGVMIAADVIALAMDKGFDPDSWRRL